MEELTVADPPAENPKQPPHNPFYKPVDESDEVREGTTKERTTLDEGPVLLTMPDRLSSDSVRYFHRWIDDQKDRAEQRAGGQHKRVPLPNGGALHLISPPGTDKWRISSYDFSWISGMQLMTATVHAEANGWELLDFDTPKEAVDFVAEKPIPSVVQGK